MDNGDPYDPPENPPIIYPPSLIPSQQRESAAPTRWPRQDGAAGTGMVSLLEEDGTSVVYNLNNFRYSSPAIDVAERQYSMVHADLENATGLEPHPYWDRESPPTQTIQPLEYRESPLQEQNAHLAISNIESVNSLPIQEELSSGLEELAVSNIAHDKRKRVFRNRQYDMVSYEQRSAAMELNFPAMTVERNTTRNDGPDEFRRRLATFTNWPKERIVSAYRLAEAGFVFIGRPDVVMCSKCKGKLHSWKEGDDPRDEHWKYYKRHCFS